MFTGIIKDLGTVEGVQHEGSNINFSIKTGIAAELRIDKSVAHNGVCLTVVGITDNVYTVTAVAESLAKTNLGLLQVGDVVNLERALQVGDQLDGHFVQGHVDGVGVCIEKQELEGSWLFQFQFPKHFAGLVIEKGSICINGVSLTCFDIKEDELTVTIIPYTYTNTNFFTIAEGSVVNLEFDVLGKYILRNRGLFLI